MIAYIEGRLLEVSDPAIIVVTDGGVGYEIEITARQRQSLPERGGRVALYTELLVREDMLRLCGFSTFEERETFEVLIGISKVGPRTALAVLSAFSPAELRSIVSEGNTAALTQVSGVGKRMAETILRELAYRLKVDDSASVSVLAGDGKSGSVFRQVVEGLKSLGYTEGECTSVVQEILREQPDLDVAGVLRLSLQALARKKG